jgi:hypothetical protein
MVLGSIRWTAGLVFLLIQFHLYLDLPTAIPQDEFEIGIVLLTIVSLMVISRLRSSQELFGVQSATNLFRSALGGNEWTSADDKPDPLPEQTHSTREMVWLAASSVMLVAVAGMLLQSVPKHQNAVREYGLTANGLQTIQIGLLLFCVWMIVALPTRELNWKRMTPTQAGIWLRSQTVNWLHRDLRAIERRQRRLRSRRRKRRLHQMRPIHPDFPKKAD